VYIVALPHGHTGHVRFLTDVQVEPETPKKGTSNLGLNASSQNAGNTLVISGGDGYEDFRSSSLSEIAGREDSTNHLLLWRVWNQPPAEDSIENRTLTPRQNKIKKYFNLFFYNAYHMVSRKRRRFVKLS
jgi:hypothetical protein